MLYTTKGVLLSEIITALLACAIICREVSAISNALIRSSGVRFKRFPGPIVSSGHAFALELLSSLITRHALHRPTPAALPSHPFFSSLSISTLNFLDRSTFASKTREEKITFMKGLTGVLDKFSEGLKTRKILPSLLEEVSYVVLCS